MAKRLYVGNLPYETTEQDLIKLFSQHGDVREAKVITDRETRRSKGFGFVEMNDEESGRTAIRELHQSDLGGRSIVVNEAREKSNGAPPREGSGRGRHGW